MVQAATIHNHYINGGAEHFSDRYASLQAKLTKECFPMLKSPVISLFVALFIGCNAEHGTPYWVEAQHGGPPSQILKSRSEGGTSLVYIATPEEIKKAVEEQVWDGHDSKNNAFVLLKRGGDKRDRCELRRSSSTETHPLQITYHGKEDLVAQVGSLDKAVSVLTWFLEDDPQWREAVKWEANPKED